VSVRHLDLVDYVAIAEVTGLEVETLMQVAKLNLADSALHAPAAGFGEVEFCGEREPASLRRATDSTWCAATGQLAPLWLLRVEVGDDGEHAPVVVGGNRQA
jgi:hypothetical protein